MTEQISDFYDPNLVEHNKMFKVAFKDSQITIMAPAAILLEYSSLFEDENSGDWQPDGIKDILLEKGTPETFAMIMSLIYQEGIHKGLDFWKPLMSKNGDSEDCLGELDLNIEIWHQLLDAYFLTDYIKSFVIMNAIVDNMMTLLERHNKAPEEGDPLFSLEERMRTIHVVWEQTDDFSELRLLVLDQLMHSYHSGGPEFLSIYTYPEAEDSDRVISLNVPAEFFWEYMVRAFNVARNQGNLPTFLRKQCIYHHHISWEETCEYPGPIRSKEVEEL